MEIPKLAGLLKHDTVDGFRYYWRIGMYSGDEAYDAALHCFQVMQVVSVDVCADDVFPLLNQYPVGRKCDVNSLTAVYSRIAVFSTSVCTLCAVPDKALAVPASSAIWVSERADGAPRDFHLSSIAR